MRIRVTEGPASQTLAFSGAVAFLLLLCSSLVAQEVPDPGEPDIQPQQVAARTPRIPPEIVDNGNGVIQPVLEAPETTLAVRDQKVVYLKGISLTEFAEGQTVVRVYPPDKVDVHDGVSLLDKTIKIILYPKEVGRYILVVSLIDEEGTHLFLERPFTVTPVPATPAPGDQG